MEASENPTLESITPDPTIICSAYKKNRFYLFSRREPEEKGTPDSDRDVFNEKPSKEDIISATEGQSILIFIFNFIYHSKFNNIFRISD